MKNCPSLELLDFTECKNLDDDAVTIISEGLPRLKTLKLNGCDKITVRSLDKIYQNCHELKVRRNLINFTDNLINPIILEFIPS